MSDNGDLPEDAVTTAKVNACYFVLEREGSKWSPSAKVLHVYMQERQAEEAALGLKEIHPQKHFGVAVLRSEAKHVRKPYEIVRVIPPEGSEEIRPFAQSGDVP